MSSFLFGFQHVKFRGCGLFIALAVVGLQSFEGISLAKSGCCSWHGGVTGCDEKTHLNRCSDNSIAGPTCTCEQTHFNASVVRQRVAKGSSNEALRLMSATEGRVHLPLDNEVCFSPTENCVDGMIGLIDSASNSIDMAIYDINLDQLVHHLLVRKAKGVKVRVVVDKRQSHADKGSLVGLLIKAGVNVRVGRQRGIMHNKFTIVDNRILETGSFNYTNPAVTKNNENLIYIRNPKVVRRFAERFERIWNEARSR